MEPVLSLSMIRGMLADARAVIAEADQRIASSRERIDDLLLAESLLIRLVGKPAQSQEGQEKQDSADVVGHVAEFRLVADGTPYKAGTNKAYFFEVLSSSEPPWLTANEVQELSSKLKGGEIPMSSVSPSLTEMKDEGLIVRVGLKVALKSRLKENEPPNGDAEGGSEAGEVSASSVENQTHAFEDVLG